MSEIETYSLVYMVSLIVGGVFGFLIRTSLNEEAWDQLYISLTKFSIGILLPIHIFLTMIRAKSLEEVAYFFPLFVSGAVCCLLILFASYLLARISKFRNQYDPHFKYVSATFAGGGRAVVLLAALLPLFGLIGAHGILEGGVALDMLAVFDLGYWILFSSFVFPLMRRSFPATSQGSSRVKNGGWEASGVILAAGLGMLSQFFDVGIAKMLGRDTVQLLRWLLASGIVVFSSAALVLKFRDWKPGVIIRDMGFVVLSRVLGVIPLVIAVVILYDSIVVYFLIPIALFIVCPPSSLIDRMLASSGASDTQIRKVVHLNIVWNALLIFAVIFLMIIHPIIILT